ncbi:MAG: hypothetical protein V1799_04545 [bacterium]
MKNPPMTGPPESLRAVYSQASHLLLYLNQHSEDQLAGMADEYLLFLYRLRDRYQIVRSSSRIFTGKSFSVLNDLLYQLESNPAAAMSRHDTKQLLLTLLQEMTQGKIIIGKK